MQKMKIEERALELIAKPFIYFNVKPIQITILSLFFAIIASILFYYSFFFFSLFFIFISFLLDAIDGYVARKTNHVTSLGAFLDGVFDRIVEFLILLSLFLRFPSFSLQIIIAMAFGTFLHSFLKCYAVYRKVLSEKDVEKYSEFEGLMPRRIRVIGIFIMALFMIYDFFAFEFSWFFAFSTFFSFLYLFFKIVKKASGNEKR